MIDFAGRRWVLVALVVLALGGALAAWSARARSTSAVNDPGWLDSLQSVEGDWESVAGSARDGTTPWTPTVHLTVAGDRLDLRGSCNQLSAAVEVIDHRLHVPTGVRSTRMACSPEAAAQDAWVTQLVEDGATVQLKESTEGPMFVLDSDEGWLGFVRSGPRP